MNSEKTEKNLSARLYALKAFAIVTVILAHSAYTSVQNAFIVRLLGAISCVGVVVFFALSGYFYKTYDRGFLFFLKKKILWLIVPWAFWGAATYAVNFLQKNFVFSFIGFLNYMIGNGSYLYFMTILTVLFLIYYPLHKYDVFNYLMIGLTIASIILTSFDLLPYPYLNVFNWAGFFSAGILAKKYDLLKRWLDARPIIHICLLTLSFAGWLVLVIFGKKAYNYYWFRLSLVNEILLFVVLTETAFLLPEIAAKLLVPIGKITLPVYLMHMPIISHVLTGSLSDNAVMAFLRPIVTLAICVCALYAVRFVCEKLKIDKIVCKIIGMPLKAKDENVGSADPA